MTGTRLTGRITVALPPREAFGLFTPRGGDAGGHSEVEVTYALTPLTGAAETALREFAAHYPAYLRSWEDAIAAWLRRTLPA